MATTAMAIHSIPIALFALCSLNERRTKRIVQQKRRGKQKNAEVSSHEIIK